MDDQLGFNVGEIRNLSDTIAERLAEMVQTGALKPGEHLVQLELAERFGVSRVAMRDALQMLRQRGLAINVPRKGMVVYPVTDKTVHDIFAVRRAVEGLAVKEACPNLSEEILARLEQIILEQEAATIKKDMARLIEIDWDFHRTIYERCNNEPLFEVIVGLWARARQARSLAQVSLVWGQRWGEHSISRHRKILAALRECDVDKASRLVTENISLAEEELIKGLHETNGEF